MFKKKRFALVAIFALAAKMLLLGIIQFAYYIPRQLETINMAVAQGATQEQVTNYVWQMIVPESIAMVIPVIGFASVLVAIGLLLLNTISAAASGDQPSTPVIKPPAVEETVAQDDVLQDFEVVEGEQKEQG